MEYKNLKEIKEQFKQQKCTFPERITVAGIPYVFRSSSSYPMDKMVKDGYKGVMAYTTPKKYVAKAKGSGLNQWLMFLWGYNKNSLTPYDVRTMNVARGSLIIKEDGNDNIIGNTLEVKFTNLPGSNSMKGKADTGADVSSLHATEWNINNGNVSFKCPELTPNIITVPLVDQQAVKSSDGGTEYRPVVEFNVKVNGKLIQKAQFNLNDRGKMNFPILIGKNILQAGKFLIDPSIDEDVDLDWEYIQEMIQLDIDEPEE